MRKYFSLCLTWFICLPVFADKIPIEPIPEKNGEKKHNKELILVPSASIEDGVINIETAMASWGVTVTLYNGAACHSSGTWGGVKLIKR